MKDIVFLCYQLHLYIKQLSYKRETNWKWWKKENKMNNDKIQEEIIDIWHFLIEISIEAGINSEKLVKKYIEKNQENLKRQVKGY